jgi:sialate O-acetylesterase
MKRGPSTTYFSDDDPCLACLGHARRHNTAAHYRHKADPKKARSLREATAAVNNVPNTGLIVIIDIGEAATHPKNKLDVGKRMAMGFQGRLWIQARKRTCTCSRGREERKGGLDVHDVGNRARIRKGDKLEEYAIAGEDKKWYWADAKTVGRNRVEVSSPQVKAPKAVRYAFNSNPRNPNLTNDSGLPASPFRTDDWPDPTAGKR